MRRETFIIYILGMLILFSVYNSKGDIVYSLENFKINEKVIIGGKVVEEYISYGERKIVLDNDFEIRCECEGKYLGKEIKVWGMVEEYRDVKWIRAYKIRIII